MTGVAEKLIPPGEFLAWEREQPERYGYAGGVITMMTGGSLDFFATPSIGQSAIVEQDERRIDLYTRAGTGWTNEIVEARPP